MRDIYITVKGNEDKIYPYIWINGDDEEINIKATLVGENASLIICALFLGTTDRNVIFNTDVTHVGSHTKSLTTIRAVLMDNAVFSNDAMVRINNGAKNSDGYFQSKVLLFDDAKGRSVPSLEIDENEVKAGHGSTIGRPDQEQIFYLRSRGLTENEAEGIIISGFFDPIISLLPKEQHKTVKKEVEKYIK